MKGQPRKRCSNSKRDLEMVLKKAGKLGEGGGKKWKQPQREKEAMFAKEKKKNPGFRTVLIQEKRDQGRKGGKKKETCREQKKNSRVLKLRASDGWFSRARGGGGGTGFIELGGEAEKTARKKLLNPTNVIRAKAQASLNFRKRGGGGESSLPAIKKGKGKERGGQIVEKGEPENHLAGTKVGFDAEEFPSTQD